MSNRNWDSDDTAYLNVCCTCNKTFIGGKHRSVCRVCATAITEKEVTRDNNIKRMLSMFAEYGMYCKFEKLRDNYSQFEFTGKNILGFFSTVEESPCSYMRDTLVLENKNIFDKISKCSCFIYIYKLPEKEEFFRILDFLGSKEGYEYSKTFAYLDNPLIPFDLDYETCK